MKKILTKELLKDAYHLESIGINEYAWKIDEVMQVIDYLKNNRFLILGGDVYGINNNTIQITGDSWYINKNDYESIEESFQASIVLAINYIKKYNKLNSANSRKQMC